MLVKMRMKRSSSVVLENWSFHLGELFREMASNEEDEK